MSIELNEEQQRALDAAGEIPARVLVAGADGVQVLLKSEDFDWIRGLLADEADVPRATDPRTQKAYAGVPEGRYKRFKAFFEEDPITPAERRALLREFGKRAGWDDPVWDVVCRDDATD
jgi:hypothetical protein